jgi:anti-sigma factor RsiW
MNCKICQSALPDLLLAPDPALGSGTAAQQQAAVEHARVQAHIASCDACAHELASLQATFALLDTWSAPEVSPYFDQKLAVLLREEQAAPAAGWFERLRTRLLLNTGRQFRPAMVTAMAVVLLLGGGGIGISTIPRSQPQVAPSAAVQDLQILDKNEQAIQQMDQLLQEDGATDDSTAGQPAS